MTDLRYAVRLLRRQPGYAVTAVLTLALGIGAATALFSVVYGVLMKPLPWPEADRVVRVTETRGGKEGRLRGTLSNGPYLAWHDAASTVVLGGYGIAPNAMTLQRGSGVDPVRIQIGRLTASMFDVLEAHCSADRLQADDERIGTGAYPNPQVVVLSYGTWQDVFGGRPDAIGARVRIDEFAVTVVGVMPRDFSFPDRETRAWLPMPVGPVVGDGGSRRIMIFGALARLKPGVSREQAAAEGTARARSAPDPGLASVAMYGSAAPPEITLQSAAEAMTADVRPALVLLLVAGVLLLVTATANVGGLQLARAAARRRELAVRAAIGAGRGQLLRQVIAESALVGIGGGVAGVVLTIILLRLRPWLWPADLPRVDDIAVNVPVLAFAVIISIAASMACAFLPSLAMMRVNVADVLGEEGTSVTSAMWRSRSGRVRSVAMAGQVAVACVLLIGAALLGRSFVALVHADRGYDPANVLTVALDLPRGYDAQARLTFADDLIGRLKGAPGVTDAAVSNALPFLSLGGSAGFSMPSPSNPGIAQQVQTITRIVSPEYFRALRLRLIAGRLLTDADTATSRPVLVVNSTFARQYLGSSPVGVRVPMSFGDGRPDAEVIGVVEDMRQASVTDASSAEVFMLYHQMPSRFSNSRLIVVLRTADDPMRHVPMLRAVVREKDPGIALDSMMTMDERLTTSLAKPRLYAASLTAFAIAALSIAGVGLFGVLSYAVTQRSREIAVRVALGAQVRDVMTLVLRYALAIASIGAAAGMTAAYVLSRYAASLLYGVGRGDAFSYVVVLAGVGAIAAIACVIPARRAVRIDPITVLRAQ